MSDPPKKADIDNAQIRAILGLCNIDDSASFAIDLAKLERMLIQVLHQVWRMMGKHRVISAKD